MIKLPPPFQLFESQQSNNWIYSVYRMLTEFIKPSDYTSWIPTIIAGGGMGVSDVVINKAVYKIIGDIVHFEIDAYFTTTNLPDTKVGFTLPFMTKNETTFSGCVRDGGDLLASSSIVNALSLTVLIYKYDSSAWGIGAGRSLLINGNYIIGESY